jgi:hypothetical protein
MRVARPELTDNCCARARQWIADGYDPKTVLEFYRGDVVCLRGPAWAFARLRVRETDREGPKFVWWTPKPDFWSAPASAAEASRTA